MTDLEYLDLDDLLSLIRALSIGPVRDLGLLDSAIARPRSTAFGTEAYPAIEGKAAALLHSLARNHALVDGNKRLAWLATAIFLDINDRSTALSDDRVFELVMDVSAGLDDIAEIAQRLDLRPR